MITLYQFQCSHYCEKARWALDYKGLRYVCKNLVPGPHLKVTKKLAPGSSLPILVDDGAVVQDSTSIIAFLDEKYRDRPLTPPDPVEAQAASDWEEYLDEEIGVTLRLWFYYYTLPDRDRALRFLLEGAPWYGRPIMAFAFPRIRAAMLEYMNIYAESASQSEQRMLTAFDRLDGAVKDGRFLVGNSFSKADLTACALLSPLCAPGRSDQELSTAHPEEVCRLREKHRSRPFFEWVLETYRTHRQPGLMVDSAARP